MVAKISQERPRGKEPVRAALITAATELIGARGVAAVTTRDIAARAGVNQGLITRYFGTKACLVRDVANQAAGRLFDEVVGTERTIRDYLLGNSPERRQAIRVLIHILIEAGDSDGSPFDQQLLGRFFQWLRAQGKGVESETEFHARVLKVASLVLGNALVGPTVQADLRLNDEQFEAVRQQAFGAYELD